MTRRTLILPAQYVLLTVACVFGTLAVAASKIAHDGLDLSERLRGWAGRRV